MALSCSQVEMITVDATLGRPLRVKGAEAEAFAKELVKEMRDIEDMGYAVTPIREIPEVPPHEMVDPSFEA